LKTEVLDMCHRGKSMTMWCLLMWQRCCPFHPWPRVACDTPSCCA